ncbi:hypothetical protein PYW07_009925 [Mythimna separata]|uniref:SCP domain-containing protein n=1 Tax=Mythimna separata TaxID=271217 RepID=A0AAD8DR90_MYTSE|nr:hypothetical protein PYW07_009925 [Mythimna separata]
MRNIKMTIKLLPLLWLISIRPSRSALVVDSELQNGLHISDYCPNMKYCREGSHVMCMFYNPNQVFGSRCYRPHQNVKITADIAGQILDVMNTIRSKVAMGKETGRDDMALPRGYGIFRLKWDSELATFAQVYANQCMLKHDLCRATKRFPNPSQLTNVLRFTHPDWKLKNFQGDTVRNLTDLKLIHAVTQGLKAWYNKKTKVTDYMVKVCPDFVSGQNNTELRDASFYLSIVQGSATHMGCGLSQYSEYVYQTSNRNGIYNTIQIVCNLSHGYRMGTHSYETDPPIPGQGYSPKCGCPPGSEEDADCLCNEAKPPPPPEPTCPFGENSGHDCDSTLVLLPIFTMEDAPPEKLYQVAEEIKDPLKNYILQRVDNTSNMIERRDNMGYALSPMNMFDLIHDKDEKDLFWQRRYGSSVTKSKLRRDPQASPAFRSNSKPPSPPPRRSRNRLPPPPPPPRIPPPPPPSLNPHEETRRPTTPDRRSRPLPKLPSKRRGMTKKASIFTNVAQFQLPKRRNMLSPTKVIKKDVAPRKDFSNINKVVNDYLKRHLGYKIINNNNEQHNSNEKVTPRSEEKMQTEVVFDTGLNNAEETVMNFDHYLSQKNNSNYIDREVDNKDDNDHKLLSLLDTLEQEVKYIALDGSEKDLFDAKIRKIYGSIVGNTALAKFPKPMLLSAPNQEVPEIDFGEMKINDKGEPDHEDNHVKVPEEPIQPTRYKVDKRVGRVKNYNPSSHKGHKWKNKFIDSFDQKKYKENIDAYGDAFDNKHNEDLDFTYGDINHKHMDDLDRKYKENLNKKYSENHLDQEYNDHFKLSDDFHRQRNYDSDRKYDDNEPASRSEIKYVADRAVFREFEHSSHSSQEDTTPGSYRFKDLNTIHDTPDIPLITKDREKRKKYERKHRNRVKSLNTRKEPIDPLSLERRKYYQDKLDNIKKKLRSHRNRADRDARNERTVRKMRSKPRETERTRTKSLADNFYMPERARFLHGF